MKVSMTKTKSDIIYYISKTFRKGKKTFTKNVLRVGSHSELIKEHEDPLCYCKELAIKMTKDEKENNETFLLKLYTQKEISYDKQVQYNAGYLFLQKIYYGLKLDKVCLEIAKKYKFDYDLNKILKDLIFSRIIYPSSKLSTYKLAKNFLEQPNYELHDIYRSLSILAKEIDSIQAKLYKNSSSLVNRNTSVLYYDCTNYFFEIEKEDDLRKYGVSKEHRPNPIVQMGLFMDGNGLPLAFNINPGNTSEQVTVVPTEENIIKDFNLSKFIYCSDAGLGSYNNRWFNSIQERAFIVTQSLKKLPKDILSNIFDNENLPWSSLDQKYSYKQATEIDKINEEQDKEVIDTVYKRVPLTNKQIQVLIDGDKCPAELKEQDLIVSYSYKYKIYQQRIRKEQFERAKKLIESKTKFHKTNANDCKRFIKNVAYDKEGQVVDETVLILDEELYKEESKFDGYYCIATNLKDEASTIIGINHNRWQIEESFRILKTEFDAGTIYLQREDRIKAHFLTCFIALLITRILELQIDAEKNQYSITQIIKTLKEYTLLSEANIFYRPLFVRTLLTDKLEENSKIKMSYQAISEKTIKKLIKISSK